MRTGGAALRALDKLHYPYKDIVITRDGEWLDGGRVRSPELTLIGVDAVFIALHGEHGEDGRIQRLLSHHHIPYTGSRALASATALNKVFTKKLVQRQGIKTPRYHTITADDATPTTDELVDLVGERVVLKPAACGSSIDTHVGVSAADAVSLLADLTTRYDTVLLEEYIQGREVTVGLVEQFRDRAHYLLPVIEILPPEQHDFYSYEAKYGGETRFECPGRLSKHEQAALHEMTQAVHTLLDLRHYSRSDFILCDGEPYFLEVNTLPGLTEQSLFPQAMHAVGSSHEELIQHLVSMAHY